ncbi:hypothetical protein [Streptomyces vilmorinianum]|uniref:hypothetical protein n=1 Tax=Streptomyces vilmorinianum TaxID=3051092 RepID=UPI0010FBB735|nr:hypothetical protein [Streptomyces vilmorinianum]
MLATGRMHGFESPAERRLLLASDFVGGVEEALAQPFRLRFRDHTPDFLAPLPGTAVLIDVRPAV